jgi:hypothetical protein
MQPSWPSDEGTVFKFTGNFVIAKKLDFIAVLTSTSPGDMFIWMPKEHLYVLVYLVTVMHSMQGGYMDKAQKYTDKAFTQIEKLKSEFFYSIFTVRNLF